MDCYGKILKKREHSKFDVKLLLLEDLSKFGSYSQTMQNEHSCGFTQVIVNSYLMLNIAESMIKDGWVILKLAVDDPAVDIGTKNEIKSLIELIKQDSEYFSSLSRFLDWALDDGSIFIDKISFGKIIEEKPLKFDVSSNGILFGNGKEIAFETYIKTIIEEYLNE